MSHWFIGTLSVVQVYSIFDRTMGYGSTHFLPLVALSIFKHFEKELMEVSSEEDMKDVFVYMLDLNVIEMINNYLFD